MTTIDREPVPMSSLRSGNVISVPRKRDKDGNPTEWENRAMVYAETEYEDNDSTKPYGVIMLDSGEKIKDPYPEIPKWNVVDPGEPFEAVYDDTPGGKPQYRRKAKDNNADHPTP